MEVLISIKSKQESQDENDIVEFTTSGKLSKRNGKHYISYRESEMTGMDGALTVVTVEENCVTITRGGRYKTNLILESGKRHLCPYLTPFGQMTMGVSTGKIQSNLENNGGKIKVDYTLELNHSFFSSNFVEIDIKGDNQKCKAQ